jgi:hypothetical protein
MKGKMEITLFSTCEDTDNYITVERGGSDVIVEVHIEGECFYCTVNLRMMLCAIQALSSSVDG